MLRKQKLRLAARRGAFQDAQGRRKPGSMNRHKSQSIKARRWGQMW